MPITGSQPALMTALFGRGRFGATRFGYHSAKTFLTVAGVQRRADVVVNSLTITLALDDLPDTCAFQTDGDFTPGPGDEVIVRLGSINNQPLFGGHIIRPTHITFQKLVNDFVQVQAIDYTWLLNRTVVNLRYVSQSATFIVISLLNTYAPDFYTTAVQADLATIPEITFTHESLTDALTRVMKLVGGYWYVDPLKVVHAFVGDEATVTQPRKLDQTHPSLQDLMVDVDLAPVRTRVLYEGLGSQLTADAAPGATTLSLDDVSMFTNGSSAAVADWQRLTYTGKSDLAAPSAPTTSATGIGKPAGAYKHKVTFLDDAERETAAGSASAGATASSASTPGQLNYVSANPGGGLTAGTYNWVVTFAAPGGLETAASTPFGLALGASGYYVTLNGFTSVPAGCTTRLYRTLVDGSDYFFVAEFGGAPSTYNDSTADANLGPAPGAVTGIGQTLSVTSIPTSGDARVKGRRLYRTKGGGATYFFLADLGDNSTTTYTDNIADSALGKAAPVDSTFPGLLTGVAGVTAALPNGTEIHLLAIVDDVAAQASLAARIGHGDTGIREEYVQDRRLSLTEATARAQALLDLRSDPRMTARCKVRDLQAVVGRTLTIPGYPGVIVDDGALGFWRVGDSDLGGTTAYDRSGFARIGTYSGTYTQGAAGALKDGDHSLTLAGAGYVTMGDVAAFEFTGAFSAEAWINTASAAGQAIVGKFALTNIGWLMFQTGGVIRFLAYTAGSVAVFSFDTPATYHDGLWHHVVCTWDGTTGANKVQIYVDGVVVKQGTASAGTPGTGADPFVIGAYSSTFVSKFTGSIDEVAVYGTELTPTQIANHYARRLWPYPTGTVKIQDTVIREFSANGAYLPVRELTASSERFSFEDLLRQIETT